MLHKQNKALILKNAEKSLGVLILFFLHWWFFFYGGTWERKYIMINP